MWQIKKWGPITGLILFFTFASHAAEVPIQLIIRNPAQFDGKSVTIRGTAAAVNETISHSGNAYSTLKFKTRALRSRSSLGTILGQKPVTLCRSQGYSSR